ncbi:hypothetical protein F7725_025680, partial [Dissostichus mawsoni]
MNNMNMHMPMPMNGGYPPNNPPALPASTTLHLRTTTAPRGPRMMGPPPGQGRGDNGNYWGDDSMRGGPPAQGGHFHRGGRGRGGGEPGFRGRGRGGPRGGHNNMNAAGTRATVLSTTLVSTDPHCPQTTPPTTNTTSTRSTDTSLGTMVGPRRSRSLIKLQLCESRETDPAGTELCLTDALCFYRHHFNSETETCHHLTTMCELLHQHGPPKECPKLFIRLNYLLI